MFEDQQEDALYMAEALHLAEKARGRTSPNPMVGAVVVKEGRLIGKGYHTKAGAAHAEIEAFQDAQESLQGATLYVTLEPCCMYGKTPPCTEAILRVGIRRVVAAMIDPDPRVNGKGFQQLREAGIDVEVGLLEHEARRLNEAFIKYTTTGLPFVISKFAMSLNGKITTKTGDSKYITNEASRAYVHRLRDQVDAIMVGIDTVLADDPLLTNRLPDACGKNPQRIIVDTHLSMPLTAKIVKNVSEATTTIFTGEHVDQQKVRQLRKNGVDIQTITYDTGKKLNLQRVFEVLGERKMLSVLLEDSAEINGSVFRHNLVDKVLVFIAPLIIGGKEARSPVEGTGIEKLCDAIKLSQVTTQRFGEDILVEGYVVGIKN
jgi:diaminohydroxyphosphoribosylaminopyrimidine deaminase/5-amino-6-(5-phosphoribosylamino)uracil reductase